MSVSVGVSPDGLGGRLGNSPTHMVVAELGFCRAIGAQTSVFFSDSAGDGSQSLATRLFLQGRRRHERSKREVG